MKSCDETSKRRSRFPALQFRGQGENPGRGEKKFIIQGGGEGSISLREAGAKRERRDNAVGSSEKGRNIEQCFRQKKAKRGGSGVNSKKSK